jgi:hypothetical protein
LRYRPALLAGLALLLGGYCVYLPINAVAGRYTLPAAWGLDLLLAVFFSVLAEVPLPGWRRGAFGMLVCGVAVIAAINVGRQLRVTAHNALLWEVLEDLEREPSGTVVAWIDSDDWPLSEGGHFQAHLQGRGRSDLDVRLVARNEGPGKAPLALSGAAKPPARDYCLVREFRTDYWAGWKSFRCYLWARQAPEDASAVLHEGR